MNFPRARPRFWVRLMVPGFALAALNVAAETLPLPPADVDLIGRGQVVVARYEDTLLDIARRGGLG